MLESNNINEEFICDLIIFLLFCTNQTLLLYNPPKIKLENAIANKIIDVVIWNSKYSIKINKIIPNAIDISLISKFISEFTSV